MDAQTIYSLLKPHLEMMKPQEKKSLSNLILGTKGKRNFQGKRRVISLVQAKKKIIDFRRREMEQQNPS